MSEGVRDLLVRGIAAARANSREEARFYLEWVLRSDGNQEQRLEATYWLSEMVDDPAKKRDLLSEILAMEPYNARARRALGLLDGKLKAEEVIDPDLLALAGEAPATAADAVVLLAQGVTAARERRKEEARSLLTQALQGALQPEQRIQAWLWLTEVCDDLAQKRSYLQQVLTINPEHLAARRGLEVLAQRRSDPVSIPEPEPAPLPPPVTPSVSSFSSGDAVPPQNRLQAAISRRYVCGRCGGKMAFQPGRNMIRCDYCGYEMTLIQALNNSEAEEKDFMLTLATAKGHTRPTQTKSFKCQSCGATFLLSPGLLSLSCAYCSAPHVVELPPQELILPQGVVPFAISETEAKVAYREWAQREKWMREAQSSALRGLYLPMWTFEVGGEARWTCAVTRRNSSMAAGLVIGMVSPINGLMEASKALGPGETFNGVEAVLLGDLRVPASHRLPMDLGKVFDDFMLEHLEPYDPRYLADWPAEVYQISVSDASLVARSRALDDCRSRVEIHIDTMVNGESHETYISSAGIAVEYYKLLLVPFWVAHCRLKGETYVVVVNGQTADVRSQKPAGALKKLFGGLLG